MKQFGVGQPVRRIEDRRFLTGRGRYLDDMVRPYQAHAAMLRSSHAHAGIRAIDTTEAAAAPGVLAVLTGADLAADGVGRVPCVSVLTNRDGSTMAVPPRPAIVTDRVRHVGDTVAMVVAKTAAQARDAAELIAVDYAPLPAVVETGAVLDARQPAIWDECPNNRCFDWEIGDREAVERAAAAARHRVSLTLVNNRIVVNSMEPRGAVGEYDPGEEAYTLWSSTQGSHFVRNLLAEHVFHIPENRVRVVTHDVGGGFGMKLFLYPEQVLVLWAAKRLGRPVKWVPDRSESFMSDTQGRDNIVKLDLALDDGLRFLGLSVELVANMGAYLSNFAPEIPTASGAVMYSGVYAFPAIHVAVEGVYTNTVPVDAYRGAGRPEAAYAVERLIDHAARQLGVAPDELRRRNFIRPEAMPHTTPLGLNYDSGDFARNMDQAIAAADAAGFAARRSESRARGRYRGLGHAVYIEQSGFPPDEFAELRFDPSGTLTLLMGTQSSGQGHQTAYAQLAAERLGLPLDKIRVLQGDAVARAAFNPGQLPPELEPGFAESGHFTPPQPTFPNGCHVCEIEIDPETGEVAILRYLVVDDFGTVINPLLLAGQVHGGIAQGVGQAMLERTVYDPETGQLLTGSISDYALPRAEDLPRLEFSYNVVPCRTNPLGVKGAGEAGAIGAPPALMNAVLDAVAELGIENLDMPLTPEYLWRALRGPTLSKAA